MNYENCGSCGDVCEEQCLIDGRCKSCYALETGIGSTVELPRATVEKLVWMAKSRHPTACTKVAPMVENGLKNAGVLDDD